MSHFYIKLCRHKFKPSSHICIVHLPFTWCDDTKRFYMNWEFSITKYNVETIWGIFFQFSRYDMLAAAWIISYLLENFRTIHRLYRYSSHGRKAPDGLDGSSNRILKRWLTFRNIYILVTDLIFLISLILKSFEFISCFLLNRI